MNALNESVLDVKNSTGLSDFSEKMLLLKQEIAAQELFLTELVAQSLDVRELEKKIEQSKKLYKIHEEFAPIDHLFNEIERLSLELKSEKNSSKDKKRLEKILATQFVSLFELLFVDSENKNHIASQLNTNNPDSTLFAINYFKRMTFLKTQIDSLPLRFFYKKIINNRFLDNCSIHTLKCFHDLSGDLDSNELKEFTQINMIKEKKWTVEVKTWGTEHEISDGLRNMVKQRWEGDEYGHASITMYVPANEEGLRLVSTYCLNPDGSIKIPHQIKRYGHETVYEIYWSFWPGVNKKVKLHTFKEDVVAELKGFEYQNEDTVIIETMPLELQERLIQKKNRQNLLNETKNIMLPPRMLKNMAVIEQDTDRHRYLRLKVKRAQIKHDIAVLEKMNENYFSAGKKFSPDKLEDNPVFIEKNSNLLVLLKRYINQLPDYPLYSVLHEKNITRKTATHLKQQILQLIKSKQKDSIAVKQAIDKASGYIFFNKKEIKNKLAHIKQIQKSACNKNTPSDSLSGLESSPQEASLSHNLFDAQKSVKPAHSAAEEISSENKQAVVSQMRELQALYQQKSKLLQTKKQRLRFLKHKIAQKSSDTSQLNAEKERLQQQILLLQLSSDRTSEDLIARNLISGMPTKNVVLEGFHIESILKKANEILEKTSTFDLKTENCSTTSMKLLNAGAPEEVRSVFIASEKQIDEKYASNALLSNPQQVYSSSIIATELEDGNKKRVIKPINNPELSTYYQAVNRLIEKSDGTTFSELITMDNAMQLLWISRLLINNFIKVESIDVPENKPESFFKLLHDALQDKKSNSFCLIHSNSPLIALYEMTAQLKKKIDVVPFFDKDTHKIVEQHVTAILAKQNLSKFEKKFVKQYKKMVRERNERIESIEQAIFDGRAPYDYLLQRKNIKLSSSISVEEKINGLLSDFIAYYQPKLLTNTSVILQKISDPEILPTKKLNIILGHLLKEPHGLVEKSWSECRKNTPLLVRECELIMSGKGEEALLLDDLEKKVHIEKYIQQFNQLLKHIDKLDTTGLPRQHCLAIQALLRDLNDFLDLFMESPTLSAFLLFKMKCENAVLETESVFEQEPSFFSRYLKPLFNNIIQLLRKLASILLIPQNYQPGLFKSKSTKLWEDSDVQLSTHQLFKK